VKSPSNIPRDATYHRRNHIAGGAVSIGIESQRLHALYLEFSGEHYVNTENEMKKSRYTESQVVRTLKEVEGGRLVKEVCRVVYRITNGFAIGSFEVLIHTVLVRV